MNNDTLNAYNKYANVYDAEGEEFWKNFPITTINAFVQHLKGKKVLNVGSGSGR